MLKISYSTLKLTLHICLVIFRKEKKNLRSCIHFVSSVSLQSCSAVSYKENKSLALLPLAMPLLRVAGGIEVS